MVSSRESVMSPGSPHSYPRESVLGCVLAGGLSRRMGGGDKTLLELAGRPLLAHVIGRLAPQVGRVVLNANGDPGRFERFGLAVVPDTVEGFLGPLAGVLAALRHAETCEGVGHVVTAAGDTPFFPDDLVARLAAGADTPETIAMAASAGRPHPVFALWPVGLADDLEARLREADSYSLLAWARRHRLRTVEFDLVGRGAHTIDPFFNANTPEDLATAGRYGAELVP